MMHRIESDAAPASRGVRRRSLLLSLPAVMILAGCGGERGSAGAEDQERALTSHEAELLGLVRFRLYQEEKVRATMQWPGSDKATITGTVDLLGGLGYGEIDWRPGGAGAGRVIGWNSSRIATAEYPRAGADAPARGEWSTRALSSANPQDIFFAVALTLGSDRPENPALIRQSSARFLRRDSVGKVAVSVFSGPTPAGQTDPSTGASRTRYWIDESGRLQRFEAYLGDPQGRFARLTRSAEAPDVPDLPKRIADVLAPAATPAP